MLLRRKESLDVLIPRFWLDEQALAAGHPEALGLLSQVQRRMTDGAVWYLHELLPQDVPANVASGYQKGCYACDP